ncbi:peptidyl-prolyl cis-trans isomerase (rotamase) [Longispora fulva]|uniref:Peptidyl-prolyl cis-trans isomerase B (Cyclophilin B) n=1 Tax=Longispora fulva TaxID=619741 RepID=A0A8J7GQ94_9ACTN|nr:peptidylprolyl isomerase [Longispora fulva]MBG6141790.1 peptidyl-prolyl cis-trans isomerase B (cyclophilin B) [Longispora fulva]GIG59055.1 peptidyl-prolyl cis-trans isomerase (rotamase) [Longispora fulva]
MASSRDRQRQLARAKLDRQTARRTARARRQRQIRAGVAGGIALLVIVVGALWMGGVFDKKPTPPAAIGDCTWQPNKAPGVKDVGTPATTGMAKSGVAPMEITTNLGAISAELDVAKSPCAAESFRFLASKKYFDNGPCHRLSTENLFVLQCGSHNAEGTGEPGYTYASENLPQVPAPDPTASPSATPTEPKVTYAAGTIALVTKGANTNSGQFMIFYKDTPASPAYSVVGKVTKGLDLITKAAEAGAVDASGAKVKDGKPKNDIIIQSLTVAKPTESAT